MPEPDKRSQTMGLEQVPEAALSGILAISADAVVTVDEQQRIVLFNQGAERIFGYTADEVLGQSLDLLIPAQFRGSHRGHLAEFSASPVVARKMGERREVMGLRKGGVTFPAEASISKLDVEGRRLFTAVLRDVTERHESERERARLYEAAQLAIRARDDVLGIVSHDLRNPLSVIGMCAGALLEDARVDDTTRELADTIRQSAEWMNRLIQDLLDVASIEAGRLALERRPQDVVRLVAEASVMLEPLAAERSLQLVEEVPDDLPPVLADGGRVIQVLSNLVGNGIKFTAPGGRITMRAERAEDAVHFSVSDTGVGISTAHLPHVFDRFWQARKNSPQRGTGLGLAIVRGIIDAHGGRIWVESVEGRGTTFHFTLPTSETSDAAPHTDPNIARQVSGGV